MYFKKAFLFGFISILITSEIWAQEAISLTDGVKQPLIESLSSSLNRNYVYPEKAVLMSRFIQQQHRKKEYKDIKDPRQFANQITRDIRTIHKDNHLAVRYDPNLEKRILAFEATLQQETAEIDKERSQNFFFKKAEILSGNIGYVLFTNFADTSEFSRKTVRAALQFVANTDALILDLRNNVGGRPEMAKEIAGYFFDKPQLTGRSFNRINNTWTDEWVGDQPEITKNLHLAMPVYILTSERTFSAAEGLAYNLKYLRHAVVVGDTTRGGAHTTRSFALGNGFVAFIPFMRSEHVVTKTDWEATGVIPTIAFNEDSSLLKVQQLILARRLNIETDSIEHRKLQWLLNDLKTKKRNLVVPQDLQRLYTGAFEEFLFTLEEGKLFCRNTHQRDKKDELVAISDVLFKMDEQSQVEFIKDESGSVNSARLYWSDGWVDTIQRNK